MPLVRVTEMSNLVQTWVINDQAEQRSGAIRINRYDAHSWNQKGYGVFHTVNNFFLKRRSVDLGSINAWAIDLDGGDKESQLKTISRGLLPTMLVESKAGYHVYWKAKDGTLENYKAIVKCRLVPFYNADPNASDVCRILRTPGYLHQKDPANPFLIKKVYENHVEYSERDMFFFYKDTVTKKKQKRLHDSTQRKHPMTGDFWENVWNLNCELALDKLSGTEYVGGERYTFRENSSGTKNIVVDGKMSSCWIDLEGRIGSSDDGGPTIAQWLNWFHKDYSRTVEIIKREFPECQKSAQINLI